MKRTNSAVSSAAKDEGLLVTVARTMGSTLGTVAANIGLSKPVRRSAAIKKSRRKLRKTRGKIRS